MHDSHMRLPAGKEADGLTFAAIGVPFSLSAVPALEAADGIEELSLSEAVLHQVWWTGLVSHCKLTAAHL